MNVSLHWRIIRALGLAAVLLSAVLGTLAYLYELHRVEDRLVDLSMREAGTLLDSIGHGGFSRTGNDLERDLTQLLAERRHFRDGHFIAARLLDASGRTLLSAVDPAYQAAGLDALRAPSDAPAGERAVHRIIRSGAATYVQTIAPISGADGGMRYMAGLFELSPAVASELRVQILKTIGIAVVAVLLTALVLYPVVIRLDRSLARRSQELLRANIDILDVLGGAIAKRDSDTHAHNYRVTLYATRLAEAIGFPRSGMAALIKGAFLHDVGKIGIADAILLKPGRLTDDEFETMKLHVRHGLEIVDEVPWLEDAVAVIGGHHEKWDGSGYPRGLAGEGIPLAARIFAIVDVFDALTSRRPYKEPIPLERAIGILEESRGRHFDPHLLDAFLKICRSLHAEFATDDRSRLRAAADAATVRYLAA